MSCHRTRRGAVPQQAELTTRARPPSASSGTQGLPGPLAKRPRRRQLSPEETMCDPQAGALKTSSCPHTVPTPMLSAQATAQSHRPSSHAERVLRGGRVPQ